MKRLFNKQSLTLIFFTAVFAPVMRFSGCVGPEFLPPDHIHAQSNAMRCEYVGCELPSVGLCKVKIFDRSENQGRRYTTYYHVSGLNLCERHAVCARNERWPESGPVEAWFHSLWLGFLVGVFPAAFVVTKNLRKTS